jgi:predicted ATPase
VQTIAQTIGARHGLGDHIGEREMLLLLDNLEQVIEAAAELSTLLSTCPNLTLLCTSRELLRLQGEAEYPVPALASREAVSLFCARSKLEASEEITELCTRLDDLPLAEQVADAGLDTLQSLVEKSLLRFTQERYWMLETIREYALRELEGSGEANDAGKRHTEFFLGLAGDVLAPVAAPTSDEQLDRFASDQANLREAHTRALGAADGGSAVRFVRCLGRVMNLTGSPLTDSYARGRASLALPGGTKEDRAYALVRTASFADGLGELDSARDLLCEAEVLFEELQDLRGLADGIGWRCDVEFRCGNYDGMAELAERLAALGKVADDVDITSWAQGFRAAAHFGRAIAKGDRKAAERSRVLAETQVRYAAASASSHERAFALTNLAYSLFALGEYSEAVSTARQALREMSQLEAGWGMGTVFVVGLSMCRSGEFARGITLVVAAQRQYREAGIPPESWVPGVLERIEGQAREALGGDGYDAAIRAGEALSRDEAIVLAQTPVDRPSTLAGQASPG